MKVCELKKGIALYKKEQKIILRMLRMKKKITADEFDAIFSNFKTQIHQDGTKTMHRRPGKIRFAGCMYDDSFILGSFSQGDYGKWLHLTQIMIAVGLIKLEEIDNCITYTLP